MTDFFIPIRDTIHTEIDVQEKWLCRFSDDRTESFPKENDTFAQELTKRGVPTVKVANNQGKNSECFKLYIYEPVDEIVQRAKEVGLYTYRPGQPLLVKGYEDMFYWPELSNYLDQKKKTHVIMTGMNTHQCVIFSLNGADRPKNLTFYVVYDLLADPHEPKPNDPKWHREYLERNLPNRPDIIYLTRQELLNSLRPESEPAPPAKATPVPKADTYTS